MNQRLMKHRLKKRASIGSSPDLPYEQAFSNVAHEYLQSRVPTLLDKEIGFQLIDQSKEGEKALGVFGFKAGTRSLLIPVVYHNGEVKGHEIIYVADQDICVPSTESWVNYLTQKQPDTLGESVTNSRSALGIRGPLLNLITRSPLKLASENKAGQKVLSRFAEWSHPFVLMMAKNAKLSDKDRMNAGPSLGHMLKSCSWHAQAAMMSLLHEFPGLKLAIEKLDPDFGVELKKTVESTADALDGKKTLISKLDSKKQPDPLEIVSYTAAGKALVPYDFSEKEQTSLAEKGYIIRDKRDETQKPKLHIDVDKAETLGLTNPTGNSIANVVMRPFNFERAIVISDPVGLHEKKRETFVIPLESKEVFNSDRNSVFVQEDPDDIEEMNRVFDALPKVKDFKFTEDGEDDFFSKSQKYYVIVKRVANSFDATGPFRTTQDFGKQGEDSRIIGIVHGCSGYGGSGTSIGVKDGDNFPTKQRSIASKFDRGPGQLRITGTGRIRAYAGEIIIPEDARVMKVTLKFDHKNKKELGSLRDTTSVVWRNLTRLEVTKGFNKGREFSVNTKKALSKSAAVLELVKTYRLPEDVAAGFLDSITPGQVKVAGIEKAADQDMPWLNQGSGGSTTPDFPWDTPTGDNFMSNPNMTNDSTYSQRLPVEGLSAANSDPSVWDPFNEPQALPGMQQAMQASQKGQRDVMNAQAILSIANKSQSNSLGPIMKAIDSLGRRYLGFCWQREMMDDQYGSADASDIESSILENFESLGEMAIAMYERNIKAGDHTELLKAKLTVNSEGTGGEE